jgi:hypothetical protein
MHKLSIRLPSLGFLISYMNWTKSLGSLASEHHQVRKGLSMVVLHLAYQSLALRTKIESSVQILISEEIGG